MDLKQFTFYTLVIICVLGTFSTSCVKESILYLVTDTLKMSKTYQPKGIIGKEAIIESIMPDQNSGNVVHFTVFWWTSGGFFNVSRALIEFDL